MPFKDGWQIETLFVNHDTKSPHQAWTSLYLFSSAYANPKISCKLGILHQTELKSNLRYADSILTMAASFIESLPDVGSGVLDKDSQKCCLCHEDYGTQPSTRGIIERPVQLPCSHILGSECITLWLTGQGNSCPLCRRIFFPREPEEGEEEYSEDDHDDGGSTRYETLDVAEFNINDQEQYLQRRRATPSLNTLPDFSGEVPDHAWRRSCERSLYKRLQARRHNIPRIGQDENSELEKRHLDLLFRDLEERGIFDELWGDRVGGDASGHELYLPSRRDMWNLMRDLGFGYGALFAPIQDEDSGWWSRNVWYPHDPSRGGFPWWIRS